jgi:hypothetical protein
VSSDGKKNRKRNRTHRAGYSSPNTRPLVVFFFLLLLLLVFFVLATTRSSFTQVPLFMISMDRISICSESNGNPPLVFFFFVVFFVLASTRSSFTQVPLFMISMDRISICFRIRR